MASKFGVSVKVTTHVDGIQFLSTEAKKRNITLAGAKAAGKVLRTAARSAAPRRKGKGGGSLRQAQGVLVKKGKKGLTVSFAVQGAKKKLAKMVVFKGRKKPQRVVPAFYDHLVQLGTKAHRLGKGESLGRDATKRRKAIVRTSQSTGGKHPGTKGRPYRKQAYERVKGQAAAAAIAAMRVAVKRAIQKQAAKVFAKATGGR